MDVLKIGIPLTQSYQMEAGGAFSYTNRLVNAIDHYNFDQRIEIVFLNMNSSTSIPGKNKKVLTYQPFKEYTTKDLVRRGSITFFKKFRLSRSALNQLETAHAQKRNDKIKAELIRQGIKLLLYLQPEGNDFDFPYLTIHWDNGHLSTFNFPEFTNRNDLAWRRNYYANVLPGAFGIFTETEAGKEELIKYTNINPDRIKVLPIFPGDVVSQSVSQAAQLEILNKDGLEPGQFIFYPAQFWAHKNHTLLIEAFARLSKAHPHIKLVFTGSDKGNLDHIRQCIQEAGIGKKVNILGFVPDQVIYTLYKNALCMVMPTFLGPSNLPPLEAAYLGCPVILSDLTGHRELMGDYALYFDPENAGELFEKLNQFMAHKHPVVENFEQNTQFKIENTVKMLEKHLLSFIPVRNTWA